MEEDLQNNNNYFSENNPPQENDFEQNINNKLEKLEIMQKALYKILDFLEKENLNILKEGSYLQVDTHENFD